MSVQWWVYENLSRRNDIAAALGGQVWFKDGRVYWKPEDHTFHVSVPYRELHEPFDADEWAAAMRSAWRKKHAFV